MRLATKVGIRHHAVSSAPPPSTDAVTNLYPAIPTSGTISWEWYAPLLGDSPTGYMSRLINVTTSTTEVTHTQPTSYFGSAAPYSDSFAVDTSTDTYRVEVAAMYGAVQGPLTTHVVGPGPYQPARGELFDTYAYPGTYSFVVPSGMTDFYANSVTGAPGEGASQLETSGSTLYRNGMPADITAVSIPCTPGETLTFIVGCTGGRDLTGAPSAGLGGWPDGGAGGFNTANSTRGKAGGGSSRVKRGSTDLLIAAGGGGVPFPDNSYWGNAGAFIDGFGFRGEPLSRFDGFYYGSSASSPGGLAAGSSGGPSTSGPGGTHVGSGDDGHAGVGATGGDGADSHIDGTIPGCGGGGGVGGAGGGASGSDGANHDIGAGGGGGGSKIDSSATAAFNAIQTYSAPSVGAADGVYVAKVSYRKDIARAESGTPTPGFDDSTKAFLLNPAPRQLSGTTEIVSTAGCAGFGAATGRGSDVPAQWWYFDLAVGATITVDTIGSTNLVEGDSYGDSYIWLLNNSLTVIDEQDDNAGSGDGTITQVLSPGRYYVVGAAYSGLMSELRVNYSGF